MIVELIKPGIGSSKRMRNAVDKRADCRSQRVSEKVQVMVSVIKNKIDVRIYLKSDSTNGVKPFWYLIR